MKKLWTMLLMVIVACMLLAMPALGEEAANRAPQSDWDAAYDVVAIAPMIGIYQESAFAYKTVYNEVVCKCATADGEAIWLYIDADDYKTYFDADAQIGSSAFSFSNMKTFSVPMHVQGMTMDAEDVSTGLAEKIECETVIFFGDAQENPEAVLEENAYTDATPEMNSAYAEITSIQPAYTLNNGTSLMNTDVVCEAVTTDEITIYIAMKIEAYNAYIDAEASLAYSGAMSFTKMEYDTPVTIHGVAVAADDVASGLASATGWETVLSFISIE